MESEALEIALQNEKRVDELEARLNDVIDILVETIEKLKECKHC